jgi:endonuclease/exonuclease/phosphatase family metal-dependent hydrolase
VPPVAVVTEETCATQFNRLRDLLGPLGYQGAANWSIPAFGRPGCSSFGNTVFWRGDLAPDGVQKVTYRAALQAEGAATQEKRNLLCAAFTVPETATTRATPMRVCGTHLHRDPRVSARQAPALLDVVDRDNATGPPTLLLGDLNLQPDAPALDAFYRRYSEADPAPRTQPRPTTTGKVPVKLDYGFVPSGPVRVTQPADVIPVPTVSDHALYVLHFAFA